MKADVVLMRMIKVNIEYFLAAANKKSDKLGRDATGAEIKECIQEKFGLLNPKVRFIWPSKPTAMTSPFVTVGVEAVRFEVKHAHEPHAGITMADPMNPREVLMLDGTLLGELERLGIYADARNIQWGLQWKTEGN